MCPKCSWNNFDTARFCSNCGEPLRGLLGQGEILQGRYRVLRVLGCGGMGAVYLAEDLRLNNRPVAVKENFDSSPEAAAQFRTEAELLATLRHPNLPQVFDYFVEPRTGKQYLVMDFIAGDNVEDLVEKRGPLNEREALRIFFQVLDAVQYLHSQKPPIIHRDIKPSNIKVQPDGTAVLVDFGIAKRYLPGKETVGAAAAVTPGYSPPEQYGQGITDARSDLYALGATLYFALTGQVPPEAIDRVTQGETLVPPTRLNPNLSPHIERAILKAMSIRPIDRFASVLEFKQALMVPQRSVPSRPRSQPSPPPRPPTRRPTPVPRSYHWEVTVGGCIATFLEAAFWLAILWAIFGGCRGCLFLTLAFVLGSFFGWLKGGWLGVLAVWGLLGWVWQQMRWALPPTLNAAGGEQR